MQQAVAMDLLLGSCADLAVVLVDEDQLEIPEALRLNHGIFCPCKPLLTLRRHIPETPQIQVLAAVNFLPAGAAFVKFVLHLGKCISIELFPGLSAGNGVQSIQDADDRVGADRGGMREELLPAAAGFFRFDDRRWHRVRQGEYDDLITASLIAGELDNYMLSENIRNPEDYAQSVISYLLSENDRGLVLKHLNLYAYGKDLLQQDAGHISSYGLVDRTDNQQLLNEIEQSTQSVTM